MASESLRCHRPTPASTSPHRLFDSRNQIPTREPNTMRIYAGRVDGDHQMLLRINGDRLSVSADGFVAAILADLPIVSVANGVFIRLAGLRRPRLLDPTLR